MFKNLLNMYNMLDAWLGYLDFLGLRYIIAKIRGTPISSPHLASNGDLYWYYKGKLHREDGPAVEQIGSYSWYINGKLHRIDGPAIVYKDVEFRQSNRDDVNILYVDKWYIYGIHVRFEDIKKMHDILNIANALIDVFRNADVKKINDIYLMPSWEFI